MKSIKHVFLAVLALATILTVAACKDEDDGPSEVASYTVEYDGTEVKATFYDNDTFRFVSNEGSNSIEGTYKGDADKDGDITLELTKAISDGQTAPEAMLAGLSVIIGGDGTSKTVKGTVSNNGKKLTLGFLTYTRP